MCLRVEECVFACGSVCVCVCDNVCVSAYESICLRTQICAFYV